MTSARIIPVLLLSDDSLVKTIRFKKPMYIGDPVNVISIFNNFEVDEIVLLDIHATQKNKPPAFAALKRVANECMIPLAYGGGIRSVEDAAMIFKIGVEKIILNTTLMTQPQVVQEIVRRFGAQSVIASLDAKPQWMGNNYNVYIKRGTKCVSRNIIETAKYVEALGVGEIFLQAIHKDGTFAGFDLALVKMVTNAVTIPVIACGGAQNRDNLAAPIMHCQVSAVAAGSLFIYQNEERGVLINFPTRNEIKSLLKFS